MDSCCSGLRKQLKGIGPLQIVFFMINIILIGLEVGCMTVGGLALEKVSKIDTDHIKPLMDTITVDAIQPLGAVKNLFSLFVVSETIMFIAIVLVFVAFVYNVCRLRLPVLFTYTAFTLIITTWEIAVIVQWFNSKDKVENEVKSKMILALDHFKADATTHSNSISNAWNFLFMSLDCCGVNAVVSTTNDFDATPWCTTSGSCQATSSQIPKTCCLNVDENTYSSAPSGCHASVNSGTFNTEGCYDDLKETLLHYYSGIIGVVFTAAFLKTIHLVIGYILHCTTHDEVEPSD